MYKTSSSRRSEVSFKQVLKIPTGQQSSRDEESFNLEHHSFKDNIFGTRRQGSKQNTSRKQSRNKDRGRIDVLLSPTHLIQPTSSMIEIDIPMLNSSVTPFAAKSSEREVPLNQAPSQEYNHQIQLQQIHLKTPVKLQKSGTQDILIGDSATGSGGYQLPLKKNKRKNAKSNNELQRNFRSVQASPNDTLKSRPDETFSKQLE